MLDINRDPQGAHNVTMSRIPLAFAAATTLSVEVVSVNKQTVTEDLIKML